MSRFFRSDVMVTILSNIITLICILDLYDVIEESVPQNCCECDCYNALFLTLDYQNDFWSVFKWHYFKPWITSSVVIGVVRLFTFNVAESGRFWEGRKIDFIFIAFSCDCRLCLTLYWSYYMRRRTVCCQLWDSPAMALFCTENWNDRWKMRWLVQLYPFGKFSLHDFTHQWHDFL